jgi:D-glycero-alpha-D-manno-heptose-7-phosphate kinase
MIISRTPFRISFFGGGTDYPAWYREHGGAVLATTIDKYCYLTCRYLPPFFEHRIRLVYSKIENVQQPDELAHPSARETLRFMKIRRGVEVHHDADLPARSGMGSSSAFTVGLLHALHAIKGKMPAREQLAREAIHVEQNLIREAVGSQDQILAAYGGFNFVTFSTDGHFHVRPMILPQQRMRELAAHLMLFYTGIKRTASNIAATFVPTINDKRRHLLPMRGLVDEAVKLLNSNRPIAEFGKLMDENWQLKRELSNKVSNSQVEAIYNDAISAGALGGKLTGAGGGGFLLLFVPREKQPTVRAKLRHLIHVPFRFEFFGSQIIFYDIEQDYAAVEKERARRPVESFQELQDIEAVAR